MISRGVTVAIVALLSTSALAAAADDGVLLRVFLTDGTSIVSYGEPARAGDRVVFSMPTSTTPNPPLILVNLPIARVDWERTTRYSAAARATRYVQTQADADYAQLTNDVATTLNDVAHAATPTERLQIVERARKALAEWPETHFNFRRSRSAADADDARRGDCGSAGGDRARPLYLVAVGVRRRGGAGRAAAAARRRRKKRSSRCWRRPGPPKARSIAQRCCQPRSARSTATGRCCRPTGQRRRARPRRLAVRSEVRIDQNYRALTADTMLLANHRHAASETSAASSGCWRRSSFAMRRSGGKRPDAVNALVEAVEAKLDAARRLRLARDRYDLRVPVLARYWLAIKAPMDLFAQLRPSLEAVKALSGSTPATLADIAAERGADSARSPPRSCRRRKWLRRTRCSISAAQLGGNAAAIRLRSDARQRHGARLGRLVGRRRRADARRARRGPTCKRC